MSFLNNSKNNTADSNDEDDVLKAEKWCADFKKNPLKALLLFCIWITLIAICAKTVWEHYLIGRELLKTAKGGIAEFNNESPVPVPEGSHFALLQEKAKLSIFTEEFLEKIIKYSHLPKEKVLELRDSQATFNAQK